MEKKQKNTELEFLYQEPIVGKKTNQSSKTTTNKKNAKKNKQNQTKKASNTKGSFNFDEEMVIGVTKKPDKSQSVKKQVTKKQKKKTQQAKEKNVKNKPDEMVIETKVQNKKTKKKNRADKPSAQPRKAKEKKQKTENQRRNQRIVSSVIKWAVLLIALIASFIFFMMSPLFNVVEISVVDNQKINSDTVISLSGIELGQNIYKTSSKKIQKNIKQNAYIESVEVSRKLPNKIELSIKERKATYVLEYANSYAYINNQGYILEITEQKAELPIIIGLATKQEDIEVGQRLQEEDLERLGMVLKIIESANGNGIGEFITRVDISDKQNYKLILEGKQKTVLLGDASNLSNRMLYVKAIIEKEEGIEGEIHVEGDLNKDNAFFREKE